MSGFTTPELNERLVHKLLVERRYAKHVRALRDRLAECRHNTTKLLSRAGIHMFGHPSDGMFLWLDMRTDADELAVACREKGLLLAPGSLFSLHQAPSTWMRFNITTPADAVAQCLRHAGLSGKTHAS